MNATTLDINFCSYIKEQLGISTLKEVFVHERVDRPKDICICLDFVVERADGVEPHHNFFKSIWASKMARNIKAEEMKEIKTLRDEKNLLEIEIEGLRKYKNFVDISKEIKGIK